jgi:CBS domain-containing protein
MLESGFRHLPVVDGGRLVGIVSIRDLSGRLL